MKPNGISRFSWGERIFHWANAGLYMVLFLTGTLLLVGRVFTLETLPYAWLSRIHRTCGVMLVGFLTVIVILSVSVPTFRELWKTLRQCLKWHVSDVMWLLKVPINMVFSTCSLPPADRFNPGQKMHLLVVFSALLGFSVSGLVMIWIPGALGAWAIHLVCFIPAFMFLALHLFLSLVNPETRKALPAMFTGRISQDYAASHHALWGAVPQGASGHGSYVSWKWVCIVGTVLLVGLGIAMGQHGFSTFASDLETLVTSGGASAILPGPLCAQHAAEEELLACRACHSVTRTVQNQACVACHEVIAERLQKGVGFHGTLHEPCRLCHAEHRGLEASLIDLEVTDFSHDKALFPLAGQHVNVACEDCHIEKDKIFHYIGIDYASCVSCHHDPHQETEAAQCQTCHTPDTWEFDNTAFDHEKETSFPLRGKHETLDCEVCHEKESASGESRTQLSGLGDTCSECHEDPHAGQFIQSCDQCHVEAGFKEVPREQFHGAPDTFILKGKHEPLPCEECHLVPPGQDKLAQAKFVGLGRVCSDCHQDPHEGQMNHTCESCHVETGFVDPNLIFVHDQHTRFELDGQHKALRCEACHESSNLRYEAAGLACQDCHAQEALAMAGKASTLQLDPDPHFNRLVCADCHDLSTSRQSKEDFAMRCKDCHTPQYEVLFQNWQASFSSKQKSLKNTITQSRLMPAERESLQQRLMEAERIGFHHVQLTQELLKQLDHDTMLPLPSKGNAPVEPL